jgi:stage V sporulation protein AB
MWIRHVLSAFLALCAGLAVSSGTFAFLLVIGVIPRILRKGNLAKRILLIENIVVLGVIYGSIYSVFPWILSPDTIPYGDVISAVGHCLILFYGVSAGIFEGCIAAALAEILHTFPIIFQRSKLKSGLSLVVISMAIGKTFGALYYFCFGYGIMP